MGGGGGDTKINRIGMILVTKSSTYMSLVDYPLKSNLNQINAIESLAFFAFGPI